MASILTRDLNGLDQDGFLQPLAAEGHPHDTPHQDIHSRLQMHGHLFEAVISGLWRELVCILIVNCLALVVLHLEIPKEELSLSVTVSGLIIHTFN